MRRPFLCPLAVLSVLAGWTVLPGRAAITMLGPRVSPLRSSYALQSLSATPAWTRDGAYNNATFGAVVGRAGDVNGDGFPDILESGSESDYYRTRPGHAQVFLGSATGPSSTVFWGDLGIQPGAMFGYSSSTAGDVNGDGFSDVIVGGPAFDTTPTQIGDAGHVNVYHGSATGMSRAWSAEGALDNDHFGSSVAGAGDVNGDGYDDILIGCDGCETSFGKVFLFLGSPIGLLHAIAWSVEGDQFGSLLGARVAGAGDVNGDGFSDVIVSAMQRRGSHFQEGRVYVYHGSADGLAGEPAWIADGGQQGAYYGSALAAAGDVNHDGYGDVLVGAQGYDSGQTDEGKVYLYLGSPAGLSSAPAWTAEGNRDYAALGARVAGAGDVNGDGFDDVVLGDTTYDSGSIQLAGRVLLYLGFEMGLFPSPAWTAEGEQTFSGFGSVGGAGDVDQDGLADVVVGASLYDGENGVDAGRAYLYRGQGLPLIDPTCGTQTQCNGDYLEEVGSSVLLTSDLQRLVTAEVVRKGAVTDGVTLLLLRWSSPTAVTFSIKGPDGSLLDERWGTLSTRDGLSSGNPLTVEPEGTLRGLYAFATYASPADFPGDASQVAAGVEVTIEAATGVVPTVTIVTSPLRLVPPPFVLVHGVWSDPGVWLKPMLGLNGYLVARGYKSCAECRVDHRVTRPDGTFVAVGSFDPWAFNPLDQHPVAQLIGSTDAARRTVREQGIAATQVDVIGHSMGGLLARSRVASRWSAYRTKANYGKGDFHKIITLGTPHLGTPLADYLIEHKCDRILIGLLDRLETYFAAMQKPIGPAVYGFQTASSAIKHIGATDVPTFTLIGREPPETLWNTEAQLDLLLRFVELAATDIDTLLGLEGNHDTIVPVPSQAGHSSAFLQHLGLVHSDVNEDDLSETESTSVWAAIADLLLAPLSTFDEDGLPAFTPTGQPLQPLDCAATVPASPLTPSLATVTLTPPPGTIVVPGQEITISFNVTDGNPVDGAILAVDGHLQVAEGTGPFSFAYRVPADRAGVIPIRVDTFGPGPENYSATTNVVVQRADAPTSLQASPGILSLWQVGQIHRLRVTGRFADGSEVDLTSGTAGTTYTLQSGGSAVVSVTTEGVVEARGPGQEVIQIASAGRTTSVLARVSITNTPPVVDPPGDVTVFEGRTLDVPITAGDPDGDAVSLSGADLPSFATFVDEGGGSGLLQLNPAAGDVGTYSMLIAAMDDGLPPLGNGVLVTVTVAPCTPPPPGQTPTLSLEQNGRIAWTPIAGALGYDMVAGFLSALGSTGGDFSQATAACLTNDRVETYIDFLGQPQVGVGVWFLVRSVHCGGNGTYDSGGAGQVESRDAEIEAAPGKCP